MQMIQFIIFVIINSSFVIFKDHKKFTKAIGLPLQVCNSFGRKTSQIRR
jgi:hypothetical protein